MGLGVRKGLFGGVWWPMGVWVGTGPRAWEALTFGLYQSEAEAARPPRGLLLAVSSCEQRSGGGSCERPRRGGSGAPGHLRGGKPIVFSGPSRVCSVRGLEQDRAEARSLHVAPFVENTPTSTHKNQTQRKGEGLLKTRVTESSG